MNNKITNTDSRILILSNKMINDDDIKTIRTNTYETDKKTQDLKNKIIGTDDIVSYCINKPNWSEFIIYDLKPRIAKTNITKNLQNIFNFANDMNCYIIGFVKNGPFPKYINLSDCPYPKKHEHPIIRKIYAPSIQSLNDEDRYFIENLTAQHLPGLYEKYCYGWFIDTEYESTIRLLCENKNMKRIILPYINKPYAQETAILDLDAET